MLTLVEESLVLLVDEERGDLVSIPSRTLHYSLAGAVLLDLVEEHRIDTDSESVFVVDSTPLGDDLLDPVLADLVQDAANRAEPQSPEVWVRRVADNADELRDAVTARLVSQGILEIDDGGLLSLSRFVFRSRRYSAAPEQEIHLRLMGILFGDDLPDPRDVAIISLAHACGVFRRMLSADEYAEVREKIELYSGLFRTGRAVAYAIENLTIADSQALRRTLIREGGSWPKAPGLPILGNMLQMTKKGMELFLYEQYMKLGPVFEVRAPGRKLIILAGPEANLFLLREGSNYLRSREAWLKLNEELGAANSLVSMDGADHYELRQTMRPGYSRSRIERRVAEADDILDPIIEDIPQDRAISVFSTFQRLISEQVSVLTGDMSSGEYMNDMYRYLDAVMLVHMVGMYPRFVVMNLPRVKRARRRSNDFFEQVLAAHDPELRQGCPHRGLIDDLLELHRDKPILMPETDMWFSVMGPFLVGLHTASSTFASMIYCLLKNPDVMARVQAEADELFAHGAPTAEGVGRMTDTLHTMQETMRIYPPVPGINRYVCNSFDFAGYRIPAGSNVVFATAATNRLPEFFPEPERFDIDRFTPENRREHIRPGVFRPFGLGHHTCLGQAFAQVLLPLAMAGLLHRREIALDRPDYQLKFNYLPVRSPEKGFKIRLRQRS